ENNSKKSWDEMLTDEMNTLKNIMNMVPSLAEKNTSKNIDKTTENKRFSNIETKKNITRKSFFEDVDFVDNEKNIITGDKEEAAVESPQEESSKKKKTKGNTKASDDEAHSAELLPLLDDT
ncbi:330_t:CDS:2, partial [Gigaspora rosea]